MRNVKGIAYSLLFAVSALSCKAATVYWDTFAMTAPFQYEGNTYATLHSDAPITDGDNWRLGIPSAVFQYKSSKITNKFLADHNLPSALAADWTMVVLAEAGDVLNWNYFANAPDALYSTITSAGNKFSTLTAPERTGYTSVDYGAELYLAMIYWTESGDGKVQPGYAWFDIDATTSGLVLNTSATTLGEGLIVGTGDFFIPIPEPTSSFLLPLGLAVVLLRRRPQNQTGDHAKPLRRQGPAGA